MGEQKRREDGLTDFERECIELSKKLTNEGLLIEAGWVGLRKVWISPDASDVQIKEMRKAFMAGALHLFTSIMATLDEGTEPTDDDMRRLDMIGRELRLFGETLVDELPTSGKA